MNRIKQLREEFKISQNDLGKKLYKTQQQISLYEKGINELDIEGYIILSNLFNCSIEYIAGKSDTRIVDSVKLSDIDIALANEIKVLNDTNKQIAKHIIESLVAKQREEENNKK